MPRVSETFPWSISERTKQQDHDGAINFNFGMNNFLGGRSLYWSGWCPEPTSDEMEGWPREVIKTVKDYFKPAKDLLCVAPADKISKGSSKPPIFGHLQKSLQQKLSETKERIDTLEKVIPAPIATDQELVRNDLDHRKCSVQGKLLKIAQEKPDNLVIKVECLVTKINHDGSGKATELETENCGTFKLGKAKLILAMGTLPPTTLVLNSFPASEFKLLKSVGERFTAHFISAITARIPIADQKLIDNKDPQLAAIYIAGLHDKSYNQQFHIQITAATGIKANDYNDMFCYFPDTNAAPSLAQLQGSEEYVVLVCACLGQLDHDNSENWFRKLKDTDSTSDLTTNAILQVVTNDKDNAVWDTMESSTFEILEKVAPSSLEYWHDSGSWEKTRPSKERMRCRGIVHEASTMWIGSDDPSDKAPVDLQYRLKGVKNVYVTGGSLWPTGGSWNPTCTMVALAMHLADQIYL